MRNSETNWLLAGAIRTRKRAGAIERPSKYFAQAPGLIGDLLKGIASIFRIVWFRSVADELFVGNGARDRIGYSVSAVPYTN